MSSIGDNDDDEQWNLPNKIQKKCTHFDHGKWLKMDSLRDKSDANFV